MTVLQARPFRSIVLEERAGATVVLKRFHHRHLFHAHRDRGRARREFEALRRLEEAGIPVPHARAWRAAANGWELELEAVEGALSLQELLAGDRIPPGGWTRLLARLGRLLARLQLAGWQHGDLHAGNLLVDAHGAPWLIDPQRARPVAPDAAQRLCELVECAAIAREALPARLRARFLVAWLAEMPPGLRPELRYAALARTLEARARARRAELVRIGLNRWLRESSRVRGVLQLGARAWLRRELADEAAQAPGSLVLAGDPEELRARWLGAARLHEHGLPVARPLLFVPGSRWNAHGARASFEPPVRPAESRPALLAALAERGLALRRPALAETRAGTYFLPPREPEDFAEPRAFSPGDP